MLFSQQQSVSNENTISPKSPTRQSLFHSCFFSQSFSFPSHFDWGRTTWCLCKPSLTSLSLISLTSSISAALMRPALSRWRLKCCAKCWKKPIVWGTAFDRIDDNASKSADKISNSPFVLDNDRVRKIKYRGREEGTCLQKCHGYSWMCPLRFFFF